LSTQEQEHAWASRHLALYAFGLVDGPTEGLMRAHAEECARCSDAIARMRADALDDFGHLPASLLAAWGSRNGQLEGLHREMTRRHLEGCASCQQILRDFGHEPVLHRIEALEANAETLALLPRATPAASLPKEPRRRAVDSSSRRPTPLWSRLFGAWAVTATAAAAFLFVSRSQQEQPAPLPDLPPSASTSPLSRTPGPTPSDPGRAQTSAPPTKPTYGISFNSEDGIALSSPTRSGPGTIDTVEFATPRSSLRITAEPPDGPDDGLVKIELVGPNGGVLVRAQARVSDFFGEGGLCIYSTRPFPRGSYELRLQGAWADAEPEPSRYHFMLEYRRKR